MTALAEQFAKAGISANLAEFRVALSRFLNSGGTVAQVRAELDAIERMSGMGHTEDAGHGHLAAAQTRQPVEDGGAGLPLPDKGRNTDAPSSSSNHDERGLKISANVGHSFAAPSRRVPDRGGEVQSWNSQEGHPTLDLPVREPKPQRAPIDFGAASVAIKTKLALSVFDKHKTSDGTPWGDIGAHELDGMSRDGELAQAIKSRLGVLTNSERFKTIRELMNAEAFESIRRQVYGA